ncbi:MAG: SCO family protein [Alphaproteobacteria bacterium]|nr:SCO family protein [Alphaproteobacteria bacterium]
MLKSSLLLIGGAVFLSLLFLHPVNGAEEMPLTGKFILLDGKGRTVSDESFSGRLRVVTFGYTFCPDICPTTLSTMTAAWEKLGKDQSKVVFLFISIDPERDTQAMLNDYISAFPGLEGLRGTPAMLAAAARNFRVVYERQQAPKEDPQAYAVDHSTGIFIMNEQGRFLAKLPHIATPDDLAARIKSYLK